MFSPDNTQKMMILFTFLICLICKGKAPDELLLEVSDLLSDLESGSRIFDVDSDRIQRSCGNGLGLVKDEVYTGNLITQKVRQKSQQKSPTKS
jgi:hypothetical protein